MIAIQKNFRKITIRFSFRNRSAISTEATPRDFFRKKRPAIENAARGCCCLRGAGRGVCANVVNFSQPDRDFFSEKRSAVFPAKTISVFHFCIAMMIAIGKIFGTTGIGFWFGIGGVFFWGLKPLQFWPATSLPPASQPSTFTLHGSGFIISSCPLFF